MPMIKAVMLVPVRDNDGRRFTKTEWTRLEHRLAAAFGGYSLLPGRVTGGWVHEGRLFRDQSRQYAVALNSWSQLSAWLEVVRWTRTAFRQEAMFIEVNGVPEVLHGE
jgi:hypothetical protein